MLLGFNAAFRLEYDMTTRPMSEGYPLTASALWGITPEGNGPCYRVEEGVLQRFYPGLGWQVNPAYVAWWGLCNLDGAADDPAKRARVCAAADWLWHNAHDHGAFSAWHYTFPWIHGGHQLSAPWASALAQGLGASLLLRVGRLEEREEWRGLAFRVLEAFRHDIGSGGLRTWLGGGPFYEEYPTSPPTYVLDGFLFAAIACADLKAETGDGSLLSGAVDTLESALIVWDWNGCWSRYGAHGPLCSLEYHHLNIALLTALADVRPSPVLRQTVTRWTRFRASCPMRMRILAAYYASNVRYTLGPGGGLTAFAARKARECTAKPHGDSA
ncbi:D-glucuronyl C5-epimerase family protein [Desulfobaculum sp. SPO524]|uniref:D-glucuronyl C5-epimerase family protein n=1 Tax=Desulfobaculum sp. SPO524 TaxID=3378071 RepID=UPI0038550440